MICDNPAEGAGYFFTNKISNNLANSIFMEIPNMSVFALWPYVFYKYIFVLMEYVVSFLNVSNCLVPIPRKQLLNSC